MREPTDTSCDRSAASGPEVAQRRRLAVTSLPGVDRSDRTLPPSPGTARGLRLVAAMSLVGSLSACLVPHEAVPPPPDVNIPPRIDLGSLDPAASLFDVGADCACFRVRAQIFDDDNDTLLVRFATNVGRDTGRARCFSEEIYRNARSGAEAEIDLIPRAYFRGVTPDTYHTISMYVTDAVEYLLPTSDEESCGLIDDTDTSALKPGVVEQRWTVHFREGSNECVGCE